MWAVYEWKLFWIRGNDAQHVTMAERTMTVPFRTVATSESKDLTSVFNGLMSCTFLGHLQLDTNPNMAALSFVRIGGIALLLLPIQMILSIVFVNEKMLLIGVTCQDISLFSILIYPVV